MISIGTAISNNVQSFRFKRAIPKNRLNEALPNTSIARSNIFTLKALVSILRKSTPKNKAQTNCGIVSFSGNQAVTVGDTIIAENDRQAANSAIVSIADFEVIKRCFPAFSNTSTYMPLESAGHDDIYVGRIRRDLSSENGITLWLTGDQIRKGAALNAVQIGEHIVRSKN